MDAEEVRNIKGTLCVHVLMERELTRRPYPHLSRKEIRLLLKATISRLALIHPVPQFECLFERL